MSCAMHLGFYDSDVPIAATLFSDADDSVFEKTVIIFRYTV